MLESGATNLFFHVLNDDGKRELVTHPLDGSVLPGIIRDSIIKLAKDLDKDLTVKERPIKI